MGRMISGMISAWKKQVASLALGSTRGLLPALCLGAWDEQVHTGIFSGLYSGSFLSVMWARV